MTFKIAQKVTKYLAFLCTKIGDPKKLSPLLLGIWLELHLVVAVAVVDSGGLELAFTTRNRRDPVRIPPLSYFSRGKKKCFKRQNVCPF